MKRIKALVLILVALVLTSCFEDRDDTPIQTNEINDFVWKAMNFTYLYKSEMPNLANDRFGSNAEYSEYLDGFSSPEELFESLKFRPEAVDRFSRIWPDYITLEQRLQGVFKSNGMEAIPYALASNDTDVFYLVTLVLPNSDAAAKGLKRGDIFAQVNGTTITRSNFLEVISPDVYTLNLGTYNTNGTPETTDDSIVTHGDDITLEKFQLTENPIFVNDIFQVNGENVGYLMYNGFVAGSEVGLNNVFSDFKANNVQHFVLDLRYNPGGRINVTTYLASMITGQFTGQVFEKLIYNENRQNENKDFLFSDNFGGSTINSLGLDKIYILTTERSASASEGIINGLNPYIEIVQIGEATSGKTQASNLFYDSTNFSRQGANPAHTYVLQPLVANGLNKNLESVPSTGLPPTAGFEYSENILNLGVLGNVNEPMLALALSDIENSVSKINNIKDNQLHLEKLDIDEKAFSFSGEGGMLAD
ncbi:S41 family peptidase [Hyunsoonleella pacifica]|uniref:Peptidase S41 n=1 Tax=Hyunsoonleella pacifica TaxID=1080224 RepID=A0A4Q9FLV7_9FLAO|nr:S41 family peptidase [Hyunsoonleella pacifica]TBN15392.1 peptidase S41 [Hyunsoonleella pacifica]GGD23676.1 peptidase S41 [Hyunsoonleella pacifica]